MKENKTSDVMIDVPLGVPKAKFVIDIIVLVFWIGMGIGLLIAILADQSVSKIALFIESLPMLFLGLSVRDLCRHLRAKGIIIRDQWVEVVNSKEKQLVEWRAIKKVTEKRKFSGGLTIHGQDRKNSIFIPFVVEDYDKIRDYITRKIALERERERERVGS